MHCAKLTVNALSSNDKPIFQRLSKKKPWL